MTTKELIEKLKQFPEDTLVGSIGNWGEYLDIESVWIFDNRLKLVKGDEYPDIVCIDIQQSEN